MRFLYSGKDSPRPMASGQRVGVALEVSYGEGTEGAVGRSEEDSWKWGLPCWALKGVEVDGDGRIPWGWGGRTTSFCQAEGHSGSFCICKQFRLAEEWRQIEVRARGVGCVQGQRVSSAVRLRGGASSCRRWKMPLRCRSLGQQCGEYVSKGETRGVNSSSEGYGSNLSQSSSARVLFGVTALRLSQTRNTVACVRQKCICVVIVYMPYSGSEGG